MGSLEAWSSKQVPGTKLLAPCSRPQETPQLEKLVESQFLQGFRVKEAGLKCRSMREMPLPQAVPAATFSFEGAVAQA